MFNFKCFSIITITNNDIAIQYFDITIVNNNILCPVSPQLIN